MKNDEFREMLDRMAAGWTARDYASVIENFADPLYYSDSANYSFGDRKSLLEFFENDGGEPQQCVFHRFAFDEEKQFGAAEYTYLGTHRYHGTVWIELNENKIKSWREYQHISERNWEDYWKK